MEETDNNLGSFQSWFTPRSRTESALIALMDGLYKERGGENVVLLLLQDLSSASDTIDHGVLDHLKEMDIRGTVLQ